MNYKISSKNIIISHSKMKESPYVLSFRDLPDDEKPREKLLNQGIASLTSAELLALILNTGTKKEDVLSMSNRILKEYGEKSIMNKIDPKKLSEDVGIPLIKSIQIIACAELGRRFFDKKKVHNTILRTPKDVFEYTKGMGNLTKEHLRGLYLNNHYKLVYDEVISIGTIDANLVHPREVFRPAIENSVSAVILVHNHPSGNITPSIADKNITRQIKEAGEIVGITLLDHVIVSNDNYKSII